MSNHSHLLIETPEANLAEGMRQTSMPPVTYPSARLSRTGYERPSILDREMEKFQRNVPKPVRQMKAGKAARTTRAALSPVAGARSTRCFLLRPGIRD